jgi:hypothetical protein
LYWGLGLDVPVAFDDADDQKDAAGITEHNDIIAKQRAVKTCAKLGALDT